LPSMCETLQLVPNTMKQINKTQKMSLPAQNLVIGPGGKGGIF
jgi:hypothetical protein